MYGSSRTSQQRLQMRGETDHDEDAMRLTQHRTVSFPRAAAHETRVSERAQGRIGRTETHEAAEGNLDRSFVSRRDADLKQARACLGSGGAPAGWIAQRC